VEFFEWLGWNQYANHTRTNPPRGGTLNLRDHDACERVTHAQGAFDTSAHTIDVRRMASEAGRHNIPNIGFFLWRLRAYSIARADARRIARRRFAFSQVGLDAPLFNQPQAEDEITHLAEEINVPHPLRRRVLYDELEARRFALLTKATPRSSYFGASPVLEVEIDGQVVPPEQIVICNLEKWPAPADRKKYTLPDGTKLVQEIRAAVDPVLGRLTVPTGHSVERLRVSYAFGFSDDMAGGPYDRLETVAPTLLGVNWQVAVSQDVTPVAGQVFATLAEAVDAWNDRAAASPTPPTGVIAILDSRTYEENLTGAARIVIPHGSRLLIAAGDWPEEDTEDGSGRKRRIEGRLTPTGLRPHLVGDLSVIGTPHVAAATPGTLILNGLLIEGSVTVLSGSLGGIEVTHCTIVPGRGELKVAAAAADRQKQNARLVVTLDHSICGAITLPETVPTLCITNTVVSNGIDAADDGMTVSAGGADATIEQSTIFGLVTVKSLAASNSIFTGILEASRRQVGCVRFSYLPLKSGVSRRHRCQPDLEVTARIDEIERRTMAPLSQVERDLIRDGTAATIRPSFTATRYGLPGFAQLRARSPIQLRTGADDEAEMGVFHDLHQPQREANLRVRLDEYLRVSLEAGIFYVS